jgi:hypothetical protein
VPFAAKRNRKNREALARLDTRAKRVLNLSWLIFVGGWGLLDVFIGLALWGCNAVYVKSRPANLLVIRPPAEIWFLAYLMTAFCGFILLYDAWLRRYLGPEPSGFSVNYILASWPIPKLMRKVVIVFVFISAAVALGHVRKHVRFTGSEIIEQTAFRLREDVHTYNGINRLLMAHYFVTGYRGRPGRPTRDRHLFVYFSEGSRWSLKDAYLPVNPEVEESVTELVTRHTNVRIEFPDEVIDQPPFRSAEQHRKANAVGLAVTVGFGIALVWGVSALAKRLAR